MQSTSTLRGVRDLLGLADDPEVDLGLGRGLLDQVKRADLSSRDQGPGDGWTHEKNPHACIEREPAAPRSSIRPEARASE